MNRPPTFQELINLYSDRIELNQFDFFHDLISGYQILAQKIYHQDYPKAS